MFDIDRKTLYIMLAFLLVYGALSLFLYMKGFGFLAVLGVLIMAYQYISIKARRLERSEELNAYDRYYRDPPRRVVHVEEREEENERREFSRQSDRRIRKSGEKGERIRPTGTAEVKPNLRKETEKRRASDRQVNRESMRRPERQKPQKTNASQPKRNPLEDEGF